MQDSATETADIAVATETDLLGPCEPGTSVTLEGIVWRESENGVLVVNVTWRDKTYVGTLLDATRHDWAPPRFNCESPSIELDMRTPKGRGKRRAAACTPVQDARTLRKGRRGSSVSSTFTAPPSPAKSESSVGIGMKRKGRHQDGDLPLVDYRCSKRSRSGSQVSVANSEVTLSDSSGRVECPEANCNKKFKNVTALNYHKSHNHSALFNDGQDDMEECNEVPMNDCKKEILEKDNERASESLNNDDDKGAVNENDAMDVIEKKNGDYAIISEQSVDNTRSSKENCESSGLKSTIEPLCSSQVSGRNVTSALSITTSCSFPSLESHSLSREVSSAVPQGEIFVSKLKQDSTITVTEDLGKLNKPDRAKASALPQAESSAVQMTHSNTSILSLPQMPSSDKTVPKGSKGLGNEDHINSSRADPNKDAKRGQKSKPSNSVQRTLAQVNPIENKPERTGVIRTNPLQISSTQSDNSSKEISKVITSSKPSPKNGDLFQYSDNAQNCSPQSRSDDTSVSDDVQSPAYSDISDANDAASPAMPSEACQIKLKEETNLCKKSEHGRLDNPTLSDTHMMQHFGMFYGMNYKPPSFRSSSYKSDQKSPQPTSGSADTVLSHNKNQEANKCNESLEGHVNKETEKDDKSVKEKGEYLQKDVQFPSHSGALSSNIAPEHRQDYPVMYQHSLYNMPSLPQYPYGPNGYFQSGMDQNFLGPLSGEQKSSHEEHAKKDGGNTPGNKKVSATNSGNKSMQDNSRVVEGSVTPSEGAIPHSVTPAKDGKMIDQKLRENQSENRQILQENIDIKNEMEKKQAEDVRRFKMYQEQKMIEERKKDLARKSEGYKHESVSSKVPGTKPINSSSARHVSTFIKSEKVCDDNTTNRGHSSTENKESKDSSTRPPEEKLNTSSEKHFSETRESRGSDKKHSGCESSLPTSPCSTPGSSSFPDAPGYGSYGNYMSYLQNPHPYMGMGPSNPMYRNNTINPVLLGGNYVSNQYMLSQMGYGRNVDHNSEKETKDGSMHKIHELSEKVGPRSRNSSPVPQKSSKFDANSSAYDKQRDFSKSPPPQRHVHTHHHTHVLQPGPGLPPGTAMQGPPGYPPVYDPYSVSALFVSQSQSPRQYPPK
ncbi:zinc finger protein 608-like [Dreissena polymorpha]|uniref:C2H2-type domain-containing protein n=1 Tax=Dreissena polymorpha TaxID=45954 RepID=A0A9D4KMV6_DREPO|nr:zinc finger protein 608-like [Dreissena polymorpha]KAH3841976.1 hypothetical protein DPMN_115463 [Dreissena polymorpha]